MTNITHTGETVFKTDSKGRVRTPPERRESLLDEFERSGLSGAKFAELAGIKYQTFASWLVRRRKQRGIAPAPVKTVDSVRWLEAVVREAKAPAGEVVTALRLRLSTGAWMEVSELNQVSLAAALVRALETPFTPC
jgi:hypothetical protein